MCQLGKIDPTLFYRQRWQFLQSPDFCHPPSRLLGQQPVELRVPGLRVLQAQLLEFETQVGLENQRDILPVLVQQHGQEARISLLVIQIIVDQGARPEESSAYIDRNPTLNAAFI